MKRIRFSFEDLEVWQKAVDFADKIISIANEMNTGRKHFLTHFCLRQFWVRSQRPVK